MTGAGSGTGKGLSASGGMLLVSTVIIVLAALSWGEMVFAPAAFAIFIVMAVWPMQAWLQARMPRMLAMLITIAATLVAIALLLLVFAWGISVIGQWLVGNAARFQTIYQAAADWLEGHGIALAGAVSDTFNMTWVVRFVQSLAARLNGLAGFATLVFAFAVLGLLEVENLASRLNKAGRRFGGIDIVAAGRETAGHFGKYMVVRSIASVTTGAAVWLVAWAVGLEHPAAWAAIAFTLNYIPFLGPLVATLLPTVFALVQFESLQVAVVVLVALTVVQFVIGSYLEPVFTGSTLSISPFAVMFVVFLWSMLWGLTGAFIGVPILVAVMTVCRQIPAMRWFTVMLSGGKG
ncbi:AI-2E family transporter [Aestuariivirga litoralis]|uniref:AI-2E family transporter n=1 Tax=Aestuariivirga litoralis TaxID=2650924 RepID=A0A2W2B217_9HYPH|nr:AI-2E family transporter [Aestuariivirga litoralis]PZF78940.1 AI-2E family transporter [Aestuariivirga litoralis]